MAGPVGVSRGFGLERPGWRAKLEIVRTVFIARIHIITRYKGAIFMEAILPIVFAALPVLLGVAVAGDQAGALFERNTGTANFKLYMLIGASTFTVVSLMLWLIGFWLRREMETGTLEALYLTPARRIYVLAGVTSYAFVRAMIAFVIAILLGSVVFGVDPFERGVGLALVFLAIGILPLWGLAFMFGAFIMKVKEANSVIQVLQWILAFLMGVFYPITLLPRVMQLVAALFPPTVMTDAVRASILDIEYFFGGPFATLAILFAMALVVPLLGYEVFEITERRVKRREGVGHY